MSTAVKHSLKIGKKPKHALAGRGPIVDRARKALHGVAQQFGQIQTAGDTEVQVKTEEGLDLTLSYDPGNYIFSRVYNLSIKASLPDSSEVPAELKQSFVGGRTSLVAEKSRQRSGAAKSDAQTESNLEQTALAQLNSSLAKDLNSIDLHSISITTTRITRRGRSKTVTVTPLGGSFVWVLIPPVFHATAFPKGEPERIISLIKKLSTWKPDAR